jgi:hypothetical protein
MRLVSQAVSGEPMHSTIAPKVISRPASRILTSSPSDSSLNMPAGASTDVPVMKFPSIKAVGAKRRSTWPGSGGVFMQMHLDDVGVK